MNEAIELHDSVLNSVEISDDILVLSLMPAYIHQSEGLPGIDAGQCFVQDLAIELSNYRLDGDLGTLPSDILDGTFEINGVVLRNMTALPCSVSGSIDLTLDLSPDNRRVSVSATGMRIKPTSEATYVEDFRRE